MKNWRIEDRELIITVPTLLKMQIDLTRFIPPSFSEISINIFHLEIVKQAIESYMENENGRQEELDSRSYQETGSTSKSIESKEGGEDPSG